MRRLLFIAICALAFIAPAAHAQEKVLRYAFPIAETGFDPPQLSDLYSRIITANIFDALYGYDYLARPAKVRPVLAEALPEVSPDYKTFTVRMRRGIYFADDPAFGGRKREVTAQDVVYTIKRVMDPAVRSPQVSSWAEDGILGLADLRTKAKDAPFDYNSEIPGLRALDRYTVQFKLAEPRPRFVMTLADPGIGGIVAREVVEKYGDKIMEHPVGTGPFMLKEWRRSSKIVLVRNPGYREVYYDAEPNPKDPESVRIAAMMKGKRLPMIDRVEISIIDDPQPRWLSFLNREHELMERLPENFATHAIPNNRIAPNLAKLGIQMERVPLSDIRLLYFSMTHPVVGGYTPEKVALRRAVALAMNADEEARLAMRGQAMIAQGFVMPNTASFDPDFRSEMGTFDKAKAIALLDMFGYVDKDGDGWRDLPDGKPLVLVYDTLSAADYRERDEVMKKNLDAIGIKLELRIGKWPEQLRSSRAGKLMMWGYGLSASSPNSGPVLAMGYSKQVGGQNHSRFSNKKFDELYERIQLMPDGAERDALIKEAQRILIAYMPIKVRVHRIGTDLMQPWLIGYKRHPNAREFWQYVDIDTTKLPTKK
ncbi:ABC transporter substrate-binding protein [Ramlibacter albus]|uniref:Bicyclomycin resistance protein n=1 Tax=Ramlibacter albus TaxID=2079448 RepID=A0A923S237_9BURK|nr:ABC transporter substrate-binding protein [Ramlibacter albus]MBC5764333.1 bicyclomycin resistance protein [Ramlibacter albus]